MDNKTKMPKFEMSVNVILFPIIILMIISFLALWIVGWGSVNAQGGSLSGITFSSVLATDEDLRILYSGWLTSYFFVGLGFLFLVCYEPIMSKNFYATHTRCHVMTLNSLYMLCFYLQMVGFVGVLAFPVTDPESVEAHYICASLVFGSAILTSWVLCFKRWVYQERSMLDERFLRVQLIYWNILYCLGLLIAGLFFVIESFEEDYFRDKGFVEFAIILFCVLDRLWELYDFQNQSFNMALTIPSL